jgi:hypothetical protein
LLACFDECVEKRPSIDDVFTEGSNISFRVHLKHIQKQTDASFCALSERQRVMFKQAMDNLILGDDSSPGEIAVVAPVADSPREVPVKRSVTRRPSLDDVLFDMAH